MNNIITGLTTPTTKKPYHTHLTHNTSSAANPDLEASELSPQRGRNKGYEYWLEAQCLLHGHGIEPNKDFAITWFERSAAQGEPKALTALGLIYEQGNGVRVDIPKAMEYFRQGAAMGEPQAQYKMAMQCMQEMECKKAVGLLESAAGGECREAMRELGQVYERGGVQTGGQFVKIGEVDLDKAQELYLRAADLGDSLAKNYLGSFFFNHSKEYEKAVNLFRQATDCPRA